MRLSTGKKYVVRFRAAYHGHTSGVDALSALGEDHRMIYLNEMDDKTLLFLEEYHYLIAAVIVNPMMFFTGVNAMSPPGEKMTAGKRDRPQVTREQYAEWLHKLNEKCQYWYQHCFYQQSFVRIIMLRLHLHDGSSSSSSFSLH